MKYFLSILLFITVSAGLLAQDKKPPETSPNSFDPNPVYLTNQKKINKNAKVTSNKSKRNRSKKDSFEWQLQQKKKEYDKRMVANSKRYKHEARLSKKPQYSDPSYFGHKRKPKKRPVGKRKRCKECLIIH